jgi:hypothetical protein
VLVAPGTTTARSPVRATGKGVVCAQVTLFTLKVSIWIRFQHHRVAGSVAGSALVTTVTFTVPGTVKLVVPFPLGTVTTARCQSILNCSVQPRP